MRKKNWLFKALTRPRFVSVDKTASNTYKWHWAFPKRFVYVKLDHGGAIQFKSKNKRVISDEKLKRMVGMIPFFSLFELNLPTLIQLFMN